LLVLPRWRMVLRNILLLVVLGLIVPPLLYIYLPLREWMGSDWTFGNTSTWEGFWRMFLNIKAARFIEADQGTAGWLEGVKTALNILNDDLPLVLHGVGTVGLFAFYKPGKDHWRYAAALLLALLPFVVTPVIIYAGFVGDALLAVKLPVSMFTGLGIAWLISRVQNLQRLLGYASLCLGIVAVIFCGWRNYPQVIDVTKDHEFAEQVISIAEQVAPPPDGHPTTLVAMWGDSYWALAYAQAYRGQLPGLNLVDHNARPLNFIERGDRLLTLSDTFNVMPLSRWKKRLGGELYMASVAPGVAEVSPTPILEEDDVQADINLDLQNGLKIRSAKLTWTAPDQLLLTIYWEAVRQVEEDYSVAVHLVALDPPQSGEDILFQADAANPVDGWYSTSRWRKGEIVSDCYSIIIPEGSTPAAVRVALYRTDPEAGFINSPWLSLPLPPR